MKNVKSTLKAALAVVTVQALFTVANPFTPIAFAAGGADVGGGSSYQGELLDKKAKDNSLLWYAESEVYKKLNTLFVLLAERLPDFSSRYIRFQFDNVEKKRFVLVDKLPEAKETDAKHDVADKLVALQRGPIVWTLKSFYEQASDDEKIAFHIHEFLVSEKLKKGPLSKRDMEEVINVTAFLTENLEYHLAK